MFFKKGISLKLFFLVFLSAFIIYSCDDFSFYGLGLNSPHISPEEITLYVNEQCTFTGSGGKPPYYFSISSGNGIIELQTGLYTAPGTASGDTVLLTDSAGRTAQAPVTVLQIIPGAVMISPKSVTIDYNETYTFTASGGDPPYTFSLISGPGSIEQTGPDTVAFTAPAVHDKSYIGVEDNLGSTDTATVKIKDIQ